MTQVDFEDVSVSFGPVAVLENLSLSISSGGFFTLLGPSGCGKSTLLRAIAGFIRPDTGTVRFGARDMTHVVPHKRNTGLVFQDYALFPHQNVFDNVAYGLRARKVNEADISAKVTTYLGRMGLSKFANRATSELSGGQRQRVALARALVIEPDVLLMDEPLSALDANLRQEMRLFLSEIQREVGVTTIFVTHDQDEALSMADQIALMRNGQIEQLSTPHDLHHRPRTSYTAAFVGGANLLAVDVKDVQNETATCLILGSEFRVAANGCRPGEPVKLCVHHQEASLSNAGSDTINGTVTAVVFLGGQTSYQVALPTGEHLKVTQTTGFNSPQFANGATVSIDFSEQCCLVRDV